MKAGKEYKDYIQDILDAIGKIREFTDGMGFENFTNDDKTVYAVIRALEIIGEATKKIPESVRENHSDIPWREMAAMRDKLIHDYFGVNIEVVWNTIKEDIEPLYKKLQDIL